MCFAAMIPASWAVPRTSPLAERAALAASSPKPALPRSTRQEATAVRVVGRFCRGEARNREDVAGLLGFPRVWMRRGKGTLDGWVHRECLQVKVLTSWGCHVEVMQDGDGTHL